VIEGQSVNYQALQFWFTVANAVITAAIGLYVWSSNRHKATVDEIKEVREKMQAMQNTQVTNCSSHMGRTALLESEMKKALTLGDLGQVYDKINEVKGGVDKMTGTVKGISNQVNLLVEHHLKGGRE